MRRILPVVRPHPFTRHIANGLNYLVSKQDPATGGFGDARFTDQRSGKRVVNMYTHGLATIALCEAVLTAARDHRVTTVKEFLASS